MCLCFLTLRLFKFTVIAKVNFLTAGVNELYSHVLTRPQLPQPQPINMQISIGFSLLTIGTQRVNKNRHDAYFAL